MGIPGYLRRAVFFLHVFPLAAVAQSEGESWSLSLDSITVKGVRYRSPLKTDQRGLFRWNMQTMDELPKILGNADPIHYAQMLPGVQTNNEYKSGLNIQGCESSHNSLSIGGAPLYNVNHLLGFFSTFNATHYPSLALYKSASSAGSPNRLGGELTMELPFEQPDSLNGDLAVGLISSQGTLRLPLGQRTSLTVSLRASYLNLLYGRWLRVDGQQLKYSFYDSNATLVHHLNEHHTLTLDFYGGSDKMSVNENDYLSDMSDSWGNYMGALHWDFTNGQGLTVSSMAYVTTYRNQFDLSMPGASFQLPSSILDGGLKSRVGWQRWTCGIDVVHHTVHPQSLRSEGSYNVTHHDSPTEQALEASLFADYEQPLTARLSALGGVRLNAFFREGQRWGHADPLVGLSYRRQQWQATLSYALKHQYLFQTGFSSMGLPTEFWTSSGEHVPPQYAHELSARLSCFLFGRQYKLDVDAYYKRLYHQVEYKGSVLDYVNTAYDVQRNLLLGNGRNYGFSVMLNKCAGRLTGWISYAYARAWRTFDDVSMEGRYPASHERPHELNMVATYALKRHWSFGGTFVYASGTPFTAPTYIGLINDNLLVMNGAHNARRLKPYSRLNLSVNYKWQGRHLREQGVNFSLYNVLARSNELYYYVSTKGGSEYAFKPASFAVDVLPSLSYFCKF